MNGKKLAIFAHLCIIHLAAMIELYNFDPIHFFTASKLYKIKVGKYRRVVSPPCLSGGILTSVAARFGIWKVA